MGSFDNLFFQQDVLKVAPLLLGSLLCRRWDDGSIQRWIITEVEAYRGEVDAACHAFKGCTPRTRVMYESGGRIYVYLIYGMFWMFNIVAGDLGEPQALLIRGLEGISGPGRVGRTLMLDKSFYGEILNENNRIWIENGVHSPVNIACSPRVGIPYAQEPWLSMPWRFTLIS